jgi:outer membrane protein OmpA-like peptidoglycan-associated protein
MAVYSSHSLMLAAATAFVLLAGCAMQSQSPAPVAVRYNPPGADLTAVPAADITWYHVTFANNRYQIDATGQQAINNAVDSMQDNAALTATVIGKTDSAGSTAGNTRLSQRDG